MQRTPHSTAAGAASASDGRVVALMSELKHTLAGLASVDGSYPTCVAGLTVFRASHESECVCAMYEPALILVAQGAKEVLLGDERFVYDEAHFLVAAVDVPVMARIMYATPSRPYLCLVLRIDLARLSEMVARLGPQAAGAPQSRALSVSPIEEPLLDAALRLTRLARNPEEAAVLAPLVEQEILYRLLTSAQGPRLRRFVAVGSPTRQIAWAIGWLKTNFQRPLHVEELAQRAHMSTSSLHHHFKAVTSMSPLQFQKQLRLQEARRLMLAERMDAASAGAEVGYESPSHFSRDYVRQFGAPPARDVAQLRKGA